MSVQPVSELLKANCTISSCTQLRFLLLRLSNKHVSEAATSSAVDVVASSSFIYCGGKQSPPAVSYCPRKSRRV